MLPKESQPADLQKGPPVRGINQFGTGLSSTLLSSQRTTTHHPETPHRGAPVRGISSRTRRSRAGHFYYVTRWFLPCQTDVSRFAMLPPFCRAPRSDRLAPGASWNSAERPPRSPACSSVSLPAGNLTRSVPPRQIRLAANPGAPPGSQVDGVNHPHLAVIPALRPPGLSPCFVRSALAERKLRAQRFDRQIRWARPASHRRGTTIYAAQRRRRNACPGAAPGTARAAGPPARRWRPPPRCGCC
ncbi:hypothetical protein GA0074695_4842 [Micromonospora viridifaciens]|uniref:Uncharacterized protein n=1 Tax=Micromonospora viridifaciens TaxID=1881 RepID=A0A1C4YXP7_MICVI|nr:hypothetical protein GA0074695_4842 [Micromonospora viridifaciens]